MENNAVGSDGKDVLSICYAYISDWLWSSPCVLHPNMCAPLQYADSICMHGGLTNVSRHRLN